MLSVGITTFKYRFENYFVPLMERIKSIAPDMEVIVAINGEHQSPLDESYRRKILNYLSEKRNVIPVMFPCFRGLAKLWNHILITSSNDYVLILNDDIGINNDNFFKDLLPILIRNKFHSFKLNGCWSHVVLNKWEVDEVGYFDERLLGIGEEDHDFEWRYVSRFQRDFNSFNINGLTNYSDMTHAPVNIKIGLCNKYSLFNNRFIFHEKYRIDETHGVRRGAWPEKLVPLLENSNQYPYESFYRHRKVEL